MIDVQGVARIRNLTSRIQHALSPIKYVIPGFLCIFLVLQGNAETFTLNIIGRTIEIDLSHAGPDGSLVSPEKPRSPGFQPPSIFPRHCRAGPAHGPWALPGPLQLLLMMQQPPPGILPG